MGERAWLMLLLLLMLGGARRVANRREVDGTGPPHLYIYPPAPAAPRPARLTPPLTFGCLGDVRTGAAMSRGRRRERDRKEGRGERVRLEGGREKGERIIGRGKGGEEIRGREEEKEKTERGSRRGKGRIISKGKEGRVKGG